jgi:hypothetical protein
MRSGIEQDLMSVGLNESGKTPLAKAIVIGQHGRQDSHSNGADAIARSGAHQRPQNNQDKNTSETIHVYVLCVKSWRTLSSVPSPHSCGLLCLNAGDPAFGMWKPRKDLVDTAKYVRGLRKPRFDDLRIRSDSTSDHWDELDPKNYPKKTDIVVAFQKSFEDVTGRDRTLRRALWPARGLLPR